MSRIPLLDYEQVGDEVRQEWDRQIEAHGRMTHMKRTLAHSAPALRALMEWYPLEREVQGFLGERLTRLYSHAVSAETDCLICSTFFRRLLVQAGEDPDQLVLDEWERTVIAFGRTLARDSNHVSDDVYQALAKRLDPAQVVTLTAFGAMMVATNVFNNALRVPLDGYLEPFAKPGAAGGGGGAL